MGEIVGRYVLPHSPFILPLVGAECKDEIASLIHHYDAVAEEIAELAPDLVIILSPQGICFSNHFYVLGKKRLITAVYGDDGKTKAKYGSENDREFVSLLSEHAANRGVSAGPFKMLDLLKANATESIDHGIGVPLYKIQQKYSDFKLVAANIGNPKPYQSFAFGCAIADAVKASDRRAVVIASGELAKRHLGGKETCSIESLGYDGAVTEIVKAGNALAASLIDIDIQNRVRQNGLGAIQVLLGTLQGMPAVGDIRYYGVHFASGFLIASMAQSDGTGMDVLGEYWRIMHERTAKRLENEGYLPRLARRAIKKYLRQYEDGADVRDIRIMPAPEGAPPEWTERKAGACVSLLNLERPYHRHLTLEAQHPNVVEEVIHNAVKAATDEFGFPVITLDELNHVTVEVGVAGELEEFSLDSKYAEVDPSLHGILVRQDGGEGCCLPGVYSTVDDILGHAMEDAAFSRMKKCVCKKFPMEWYL